MLMTSLNSIQPMLLKTASLCLKEFACYNFDLNTFSMLVSIFDNKPYTVKKEIIEIITMITSKLSFHDYCIFIQNNILDFYLKCLEFDDPDVIKLILNQVILILEMADNSPVENEVITLMNDIFMKFKELDDDLYSFQFLNMRNLLSRYSISI